MLVAGIILNRVAIASRYRTMGISSSGGLIMYDSFHHLKKTIRSYHFGSVNLLIFKYVGTCLSKDFVRILLCSIATRDKWLTSHGSMI